MKRYAYGVSGSMSLFQRGGLSSNLSGRRWG